MITELGEEKIREIMTAMEIESADDALADLTQGEGLDLQEAITTHDETGKVKSIFIGQLIRLGVLKVILKGTEPLNLKRRKPLPKRKWFNFTRINDEINVLI